MRRYVMATLPALLLVACNNDQPAAPVDGSTANSAAMAPEPAMVPAQDTDYLAKAGAGDLFEIESSRAILAKTANADVKKFAQMMIDAHTESTAKLKAAAADAGLVVAPPALDADQQAKLDDIKAASAEAATRSYLAAQRTAHAAALALHQDYARSGGTPSLKAAAGEIAPVVQQHIDMLAKLPGG